MVNKLLISIGMSVLLLTGCASTPTVVTKTEFQTVKVPVVIVPAPPIVQKPLLAITQLSAVDQNNVGLLTQSYVITIKQLEDYADQLSLVIGKYAELAKQNPDINTPSPK